MSELSIESTLQEERLFTPSAEFSQAAQIKSLAEYEDLYNRAQANPEQFWAELADSEQIGRAHV